MNENIKDYDSCTIIKKDDDSPISYIDGKPILYLDCENSAEKDYQYSFNRVFKPSEIKLANVTVDYALAKDNVCSIRYDKDRNGHNISIVASDIIGQVDIVKSGESITLYCPLPELDLYFVKTKDKDKFKKESEIWLRSYYYLEIPNGGTKRE